jgi:hypothetical protein
MFPLIFDPVTSAQPSDTNLPNDMVSSQKGVRHGSGDESPLSVNGNEVLEGDKPSVVDRMREELDDCKLEISTLKLTVDNLQEKLNETNRSFSSFAANIEARIAFVVRNWSDGFVHGTTNGSSVSAQLR